MTKKKLIVSIIAVMILLACIISTTAIIVNAHAVETAIVNKSSSKEQIKQVQQKLKDLGYYKMTVDGIYGAGTTTAVKAFQKAKGLTVDGIVGDKTLKALGISLTSSNTSSGGYSSSDITLLARVVYSEARGEPYIGQVAVAAVVLNRVKVPNFPKTISGVVYQPWAFTAVNDGQINLTPNDNAYKAARDAINGWDPTYGSIYYYNAKTATSKWIFSRKTVVVLGKHTFAV